MYIACCAVPVMCTWCGRSDCELCVTPGRGRGVHHLLRCAGDVYMVWENLTVVSRHPTGTPLHNVDLAERLECQCNRALELLRVVYARVDESVHRARLDVHSGEIGVLVLMLLCGGQLVSLRRLCQYSQLGHSQKGRVSRSVSSRAAREATFHHLP